MPGAHSALTANLGERLSNLPYPPESLANRLLTKDPHPLPSLLLDLDRFVTKGFRLPEFVMKQLYQLFRTWLPRAPKLLSSDEKVSTSTSRHLQQMVESRYSW